MRAICCELVGLADFESKLPHELSGGMQQRASLCRALLLDPPLLLMDEPFGALDAMTRDEMNLELLRIWGEGSGGAGGAERKTILFVTHSIPEAVFLADRVVVMSPRPGRVARICPVRCPGPGRPRRAPSADFGRLALEIYEVLTASPGLTGPDRFPGFVRHATCCILLAKSRPDVGGGTGLPSRLYTSIASSTIWHSSSNTAFSS